MPETTTQEVVKGTKVRWSDEFLQTKLGQRVLEELGPDPCEVKCVGKLNGEPLFDIGRGDFTFHLPSPRATEVDFWRLGEHIEPIED